MMDILVLGRLQECRIKDLLLDRRMNGQSVADARGQLLLFRGTASTLQFRKPLLDLPVVRFEERDRILGGAFLACSGHGVIPVKVDGRVKRKRSVARFYQCKSESRVRLD